jgi:response regulator of citrate/malate metabolism
VVVLTSSRHDDGILECARSGVENYILKPVNFDNLSREVPKLKFRWALLRPDQTEPTGGG